MFKRVHLFEFCDQSWVKNWMREGFMDCLAAVYHFAKPYDNFMPSFVNKNKGCHIIDLATGGGEAAESMLHALKQDQNHIDFKITGTDLFPDHASLEILKEKYIHFEYLSKPVDVFNLPDLGDVHYTMFTAFHHFKEQDAIDVIKSCLQKGHSLTVFEFTQRFNFFQYIGLIPIFFMFMTTPFLAKKWRWSKFSFSTLIPVIPMMLVMDGFVSNLRTYTQSELEHLAKKAFPDQPIKVEYQEKRFALFFKSYMCHFSL